MISMDDPEVIESLKYLLVSKAERIKFQAMPFDGKKQCFVVDHKEGFVACEIVSKEPAKGKEPAKATVKTLKGEVKEYFIIYVHKKI
jgi:hypothetical protein